MLILLFADYSVRKWLMRGAASRLRHCPQAHERPERHIGKRPGPMIDTPPGWRAMRPDDLPAVAAISDAVHGQWRESAATYGERLTLYPAGCMTLEQDGAIAGFLISHPWHRAHLPGLDEPLGAIPADSDTFYLHDIALLP